MALTFSLELKSVLEIEGKSEKAIYDVILKVGFFTREKFRFLENGDR